MRNIFLAPLLVIQFNFVFAQDVNFEIKNTFSRKINQEILNEAKSLIDINPDYPSTWISDYISSDVVVTSKGKTIKATGNNDILTADQKEILKSADPGSDVHVEVKYSSLNFINKKVEINEMKFAVSLVPQYEAEFPGGSNQLKAYLKEKAILPMQGINVGQQAIFKFIINEHGEINQVKIIQSSNDKKLDQLLQIAISNMPRWKPAIDKNGVKVQQEFVFTVGNPGC